MVVARLCTLQCSCQRKRLAFTTIAATYVTSILVLALVPNYWVSAFMAANMYTNCLQVVKLYAMGICARIIHRIEFDWYGCA